MKYRILGISVRCLISIVIVALMSLRSTHFFICQPVDASILSAADDVKEALWIPLEEIHTEQFGLVLFDKHSMTSSKVKLVR